MGNTIDDIIELIDKGLEEFQCVDNDGNLIPITKPKQHEGTLDYQSVIPRAYIPHEEDGYYIWSEEM